LEVAKRWEKGKGLPSEKKQALFLSIKAEEPLKLAIFAIDGPLQRLFLIDFFCYYVTIKKIILLSAFTLLKAVTGGLLRGF
jgi:hypothetical protein